MPRGLLLLLAAARLGGGRAQVHLAQAGRGPAAAPKPASRRAPSASAWSPAAAARPTPTSPGCPRRIAQFKAQHPDVEVCACLGLLSDGQAERLHQAGTTAYNHNLNTAEANYADICTTHSYQDRADTVQKAKAAGLSPCSGLIAGMGETDEELVDVVFALRELDPDSVPVNFLIPFEGTPLGGQWALTPQRCLRILAMVRFTCPDAEVRLAGGREIHLRSLQPLALHIVNSIFLGDYLTSEGQPGARDLEMIADAGFTVEGADERTLPEHRRDLVRVRRRGPGTALPANA